MNGPRPVWIPALQKLRASSARRLPSFSEDTNTPPDANSLNALVLKRSAG